MKEKERFLQDFNAILEENNDMYFSLGSVNEDYKYIKNILNYQGYYSGVNCRYYFNEEKHTFLAQEKTF